MQDDPGIFPPIEIEAKFQFIKSRYQGGFFSCFRLRLSVVPGELREATNPRAYEPYFVSIC